MPETTPFESWAIVELMGHRQRPGYVQEVEIAGGKMLRVDIPVADGTVTEFYSTSALYALRPCSEELVRAQCDRYSDPRPVRPLDYRDQAPAKQLSADPFDEEDEGEDEDDALPGVF